MRTNNQILRGVYPWGPLLFPYFGFKICEKILTQNISEKWDKFQLFLTYSQFFQLFWTYSQNIQLVFATRKKTLRNAR